VSGGKGRGEVEGGGEQGENKGREREERTGENEEGKG